MVAPLSELCHPQAALEAATTRKQIGARRENQLARRGGLALPGADVILYLLIVHCVGLLICTVVDTKK